MTRVLSPTIAFDELLARYARRAEPLELTGATGAGKSEAAFRAHNLSPRSKGPFVVQNCAAIPEELAEAILFGVEKNSHSRAEEQRKGLVEEAHGGTLFLDEIADLSLRIQVKLNRFLDKGEYRRVGGKEVLRANVRIITATLKDLRAEIAAGRFREDLYGRIHVLVLCVPSLAERRGDLTRLIGEIVEEIRPGTRLTDAALALLLSYRWPRNFRELQSALLRVIVATDAPIIEEQDVRGYALFDPEGFDEPPPRAPQATLAGAGNAIQLATYDLARDALTRTSGNVTKAAELLGISRQSLDRMLDPMGWPRKRRR